MAYFTSYPIKDATDDGAPQILVPEAENFFFICEAAAFIDSAEVDINFDTDVVKQRYCKVSYVMNECPGIREQTNRKQF